MYTDNFEFDDHITNKANRTVIHLAVYKESRLEYLKSIFKNLPKKLNSASIFCCDRNRSSYCAGKRYTEDPSVATCQECKDNAEKWGYNISSVNKINNVQLSVSRFSKIKITEWIPSDCEIIMRSGEIIVADKLTKENIKVESLNNAAILVVEKCFIPFIPDDILSNKDLFSKELFNIKEKKSNIQGLKFNNESKQFDGLILETGSKLTNYTFEYLFKSGFHFSDGSPFGKLKKDRKPFVKHDVESTLGVSVPDELDLAETLIC